MTEKRENQPQAAERVSRKLEATLFRGQAPVPVSFAGENLTGMDLVEADRWLNGSDFSQAEMREVNLRGADLQDCAFNGAVAGGACFAGADLRWSRFHRAECQGTDFCGADLAFSQFTEADLTGADLGMANLEHSEFARANLFRANLKGTILDGCDFTDADLRGADLRGARGVGMNFQGAKTEGMLTDPPGVAVEPRG